jgi:hypothetical protein
MTPDANPRPVTEAELIERERHFRPEDYGLPPPLTKAQGIARRREDLALREKYPGLYVAYVDTWAGDDLLRTVLFTAKDVAECHKLLNDLDPVVVQKVETRYVHDPEEGIFVPSIMLGDSTEPE